jgi:hypothetical protein
MSYVSSLISTGHQIDCSFILEKELSQLTPMTLPATMNSQNKTAVIATKQHTAVMTTARTRTPRGSLDPNSLSGTVRPHHVLLYKWVDILIYSYQLVFLLQLML